MPTQKQRESFNDIWKSLERTSALMTAAYDTGRLVVDKTTRIRSMPGETSSASIAGLRQQLSKMYDDLDESAASVDDAIRILDGMS
jgi:hypothetical protein